MAGLFHLGRCAPIDGIIYLALAAALAVAGHLEKRPRSRPGRRRHRLRTPGGTALGILVVAAATGLALVPVGPVLAVLLLAVGGLMAAAGWPQPVKRQTAARPRGRAMRRTAYAWSLLVLFLCGWELGMFFDDHFRPAGQADHPPLTDVVEPLFAQPVARWLLTVLWLAGCVLAARAHGSRHPGEKP